MTNSYSVLVSLICNRPNSPVREGTGKCASCLAKPVVSKYSFANSPGLAVSGKAQQLGIVLIERTLSAKECGLGFCIFVTDVQAG